MTEFTYLTSEWQIGDALICAEIELTLTIDMFEGGVAGVDLYQVEHKGHVIRGDRWMRTAMQGWVEQHQPLLIQAAIDHLRYEDAA